MKINILHNLGPLSIASINCSQSLRNGFRKSNSDRYQHYYYCFESQFLFDGQLVEVQTVCHQQQDLIGVKVKSNLLKTGQLKRIQIDWVLAWTAMASKTNEVFYL